jgi:hypothetical protein
MEDATTDSFIKVSFADAIYYLASQVQNDRSRQLINMAD